MSNESQWTKCKHRCMGGKRLRAQKVIAAETAVVIPGVSACKSPISNILLCPDLAPPWASRKARAGELTLIIRLVN